MRRAQLEDLLRREDRAGLLAAASVRVAPVLRFLMGRLYGDQRAHAVCALGWLAADPVVSEQQWLELMRRFVWALNDESGAVPFGIPEAMGEIMAQRPELRATYLPILCSMITSEEMCQTGAIERGVIWALGRVGEEAAVICPEAARALVEFARSHQDPETRAVAARTVAAIQG